ncbi:hypothetical protein BDF19DRAFT_423055 [Syncephalis fuscata]|nr:hypothetical protein BDF19DRAFT_423055 [Syncephalis fuscata]
MTAQQQYQLQLLQRQQAMATTMMMMQGNNNAPRCINCGVTDSSTWRAMPGANSSAKLCNACGLYYAKYQSHRPVERWTNRAN